MNWTIKLIVMVLFLMVCATWSLFWAILSTPFFMISGMFYLVHYLHLPVSRKLLAFAKWTRSFWWIGFFERTQNLFDWIALEVECFAGGLIFCLGLGLHHDFPDSTLHVMMELVDLIIDHMGIPDTAFDWFPRMFPKLSAGFGKFISTCH